MLDTKICIVGCGVMGSAIAESMLKAKVIAPDQLSIIDPDQEKISAFCKKYGTEEGSLYEVYEIVILAVKPQYVAEVEIPESILLLSILAGTSTKKLQEIFGNERICRVMPNTPLLVGKGTAGIFFTEAVEEQYREVCTALFACSSEVIPLENEEQMHALTAISGSGPAYFFAFVEALQSAAEEMGFAPEIAEKLSYHTFFGAAKLLEESDDDAATLRQRVTSKGGTTEAALKTFTEKELKTIVAEAVRSAARRSEELS